MRDNKLRDRERARLGEGKSTDRGETGGNVIVHKYFLKDYPHNNSFAYQLCPELINCWTARQRFIASP